ncbi:hypothetical protein SPLC1_S200250 [Arthrospira platensis C1]|nr:hypothetical protein SPLC1_S200250 [Arthrospira platensis C1]
MTRKLFCELKPKYGDLTWENLVDDVWFTAGVSILVNWQDI